MICLAPDQLPAKPGPVVIVVANTATHRCAAEAGHTILTVPSEKHLAYSWPSEYYKAQQQRDYIRDNGLR